MELRQHVNRPSGLQVHLDDRPRKKCDPEASDRGLTQRLRRVAAEAGCDLHVLAHAIGSGQVPRDMATTGLRKGHAIGLARS